MSRSRYQLQYEDQFLYSNISQFLFIESQKSNDQPTKNQMETNQRKIIEYKRELQQKRMSDEKIKIYHSDSQSQKDDSQQLFQGFANKRKTHKHFKNTGGKNKFYAKNYREKQKERLKFLQEENRFLKSKIDDLAFRLKQTELQLNRLKHTNMPYTKSSLQSTRETLLNRINDVMTKQDLQIEKLIELQAQIKKTSSFDCKHRRESSNYFMSELLENLIGDMGFYFIDSLLSQKGLWKGPKYSGRQIDYEICQLFGVSNFQRIKKLLLSTPNFVQILKNYKNQWKKLYQDYLKILDLGNTIEILNRPINQKLNKVDLKGRVFRSLKLQMYFEKIKYRKDLRQLKQSWFHQIQYEKNLVKIIQTQQKKQPQSYSQKIKCEESKLL